MVDGFLKRDSSTQLLTFATHSSVPHSTFPNSQMLLHKCFIPHSQMLLHLGQCCLLLDRPTEKHFRQPNPMSLLVWQCLLCVSATLPSPRGKPPLAQ